MPHPTRPASKPWPQARLLAFALPACLATVLAVPAQAQSGNAFRTPSGNIACAVYEGFLRCDLLHDGGRELEASRATVERAQMPLAIVERRVRRGLQQPSERLRPRAHRHVGVAR